MLGASVSSTTRESVASLKVAAPEFLAATDLSDLLNAYHAAEPRA